MKILDVIQKIIAFLGVISLSSLIFVAFLQVVCRYCFNNALDWPEEICRYLFLSVAYFGGVLTMYAGRHLRVDVLLALSGEKGKRFLNILTYLGSTIYCGIAAYASYVMIFEVKEMNQRAFSLDFPIYITWIPVTLCFFLMAIYAGIHLLRFIRDPQYLSHGSH